MDNSESPTSLSDKGHSVLDELHPIARDRALTALARVFDAIDGFARELRNGATKHSGKQYEVDQRISKIVQDAAGHAVGAFRRGAQHPSSDHLIAGVIGVVAGYTRHLIHASGADHVVKVRKRIPGSVDGSNEDHRDEFFQHLLRMTPDRALAEAKRDAAEWERLGREMMEAAANPPHRQQQQPRRKELER
jgi:hypothetical protein